MDQGAGKNQYFGTSLVVHWLRPCALILGGWVQSLVRELDPTCCSHTTTEGSRMPQRRPGTTKGEKIAFHSIFLSRFSQSMVENYLVLLSHIIIQCKSLSLSLSHLYSPVSLFCLSQCLFLIWVPWADPKCQRYILGGELSHFSYSSNSYPQQLHIRPLYPSQGHIYIAQSMGNEIYMGEGTVSMHYLFSDILSHCKQLEVVCKNIHGQCNGINEENDTIWK